MTERDIRNLLEALQAGRTTTDQALDRLKHLPFEDLGFAKIDHHRSLRQGYAEVILGRGKTPEQVGAIVRRMLRAKASHHNILITRADKKIFAAVRRVSRAAKFHELSGVIAVERDPTLSGKGTILVVSAGTSDIPVAAGLHRLLDHRTKLVDARVIICVAGMEGALPSVVAGLVAVPVIAVPTSVGYGASFGGVTALLGMLNSCASNVSVVNIDNGFGAACVASVINRL